ncbi:MAG TPA: hypothetical protein PLF25_04605, partial [Accumulibacter sp.]|nr:hypothetical protein [Accumulibacter sp.]
MMPNSLFPSALRPRLVPAASAYAPARGGGAPIVTAKSVGSTDPTWNGACLVAGTRYSGTIMEALKTGSDVLFILLGGIMVLAMHSGFAFLELGTVRKKSQVNALVKILTDFSVSTIAYFFIGYSIAYGT